MVKNLDLPSVQKRQTAPVKDSSPATAGKKKLHQQRPQELPSHNEEEDRVRFHRFGS